MREKKGTVKHQDGKTSTKKDISKIKCFACHQYGHYAVPNKKKKKAGNEIQTKVVVSEKAQVDEFAKKFEEEFLFVS